MDSSDDDLIIIIAAAYKLLQKRKKKKRRPRQYWVHDLYLSRQKEGEFHTIFRRLKDDPENFLKYFRMSLNKFEDLLNLLREHLQRKNTKWRHSICPEERLAFCLRYVFKDLHN